MWNSTKHEGDKQKWWNNLPCLLHNKMMATCRHAASTRRIAALRRNYKRADILTFSPTAINGHSDYSEVEIAPGRPNVCTFSSSLISSWGIRSGARWEKASKLNGGTALGAEKRKRLHESPACLSCGSPWCKKCPGALPHHSSPFGDRWTGATHAFLRLGSPWSRDAGEWLQTEHLYGFLSWSHF